MSLCRHSDKFFSISAKCDNGRGSTSTLGIFNNLHNISNIYEEIK